MSVQFRPFASIFCLGLLLLPACDPRTDTQDSADSPASTPPASTTPQMTAEDKTLLQEAMGYCMPLPVKPDSPAANPTTEAKVSLGKQLFHEPRLSAGGKLSCSSCHQLTDYGVDHQPTSAGHVASPTARNVPTVFNASLHLTQFWDGRAASLEIQAEEPPRESTSSNNHKISLAGIQKIPAYQQAFKTAFPQSKDALSPQNAARAIAAFERTLLTPSPFDKFLHGDGNALNTQQKAGLKLFMHYGCIACHGGPSFGGGMFQKLGMLSPYPNQKDTGRFQVTKQESDKFVFKVPSLRNVAKTAPYFHDGGVSTLKQAIQTMDRTQLGQNLKPEEVDQIATFLESLTGELPPDAVSAPALPGS